MSIGVLVAMSRSTTFADEMIAFLGVRARPLVLPEDTGRVA